MNPISEERLEFLDKRNQVLNLMRKEIVMGANKYTQTALQRDDKFTVFNQAKLNIEAEYLQNLAEINILKTYMS